MNDKTLILSIQTAGEPAQVGLLRGTELLAKRTIAERLAVCRRLAEEVISLLDACGKKIEELGLVAVCVGPGSFTGIRIGLAAAKAMAHALGIPVVGVNTLEAIALGGNGEDAARLVFVEAGSGRYFLGHYDADLRPMEEARCASEEEAGRWVEEILQLERRSGGRPSMLVSFGHLGPELRAKAAGMGKEFVEASPDAEVVGRLGLEKFEKAGSDDPIMLGPLYLRASSPEERREKSGRVDG